MEQLVRSHASIGPLLTKIAVNVVPPGPERKALLAPYYEHWERRIFDALTTMVRRNLDDALAAMTRGETLFQVDVRLSAPEILLSPSASEVG